MKDNTPKKRRKYQIRGKGQPQQGTRKAFLKLTHLNSGRYVVELRLMKRPASTYRSLLENWVRQRTTVLDHW
jgi:hypothetical protein